MHAIHWAALCFLNDELTPRLCLYVVVFLSQYAVASSHNGLDQKCIMLCIAVFLSDLVSYVAF